MPEKRATLSGHEATVHSLAWSPDGRLLASGSADRTLRLWDTRNGSCVRSNFGGGLSAIVCAAFNADGTLLASATARGDITVWEAESGRMVTRIPGRARALAFNGDGTLVVAGPSGYLVWDLDARHMLLSAPGNLLGLAVAGERAATVDMLGSVFLRSEFEHLLVGEHHGPAHAVAIDPSGQTVFSAGEDGGISVWQVGKDTPRLVRRLEGHGAGVGVLIYDSTRHLLVSRDITGTTGAWDATTGRQLLLVDGEHLGGLGSQLALHPTEPLIATVDNSKHDLIVWRFDRDVLAGARAAPAAAYASARVVLVGESSVGKTGLGWRLVHGTFREQPGTHGQQFWLLDQLNRQRADGTQCDIVLWDLAGQPDYRLVHTLFLDDVDVALLLFDPTRAEDPLPAAEFWLRRFKNSPTRFILVAGRTDLGTPRLARAEIDAFCRRWGINRYVETSALRGDGLEELMNAVTDAIPWDDLPATVTTESFSRTKDHVLELKERATPAELLIRPDELDTSGADVESVIGHLATHGYVARLTTSAGEERILLAPERLNNLAASLILEARRDPKELGTLDEAALRSGTYTFRELEGTPAPDSAALIDATVATFITHNVCFRQTDPQTTRQFLVFPELMNLRRSVADDAVPLQETIWYTAVGATGNVFASLVVLMGYTDRFHRRRHWRDQAIYTVGEDLECGFRAVENERGELQFALLFGPNVPDPTRTFFQGLFESFVVRPELTVERLSAPVCTNGHPLAREVAQRRLLQRKDHAFCGDCGLQVELKRPTRLEPHSQTHDVRVERAIATSKTRFEEARFRLQRHVAEAAIVAPETFISYAWGITRQEHQVRRLAEDLTEAGIPVIFDRWDAEAGTSLSRFVERAHAADKVVVVGTPLYQRKYRNNDPMGSYVVAAESDLIGMRLTGDEQQKSTIIPVLLAGVDKEAFPPLVQARVHLDFRTESQYFTALLRLLLVLYGISPRQTIYRFLEDTVTSS